MPDHKAGSSCRHQRFDTKRWLDKALFWLRFDHWNIIILERARALVSWN